jgi:hypothetical protein
MGIDAVAATFCTKLTEACTEENRRALESWSAANRVDNPDPLGWKDSAKLRGQVPSRTFRYGMPAYQAPRPTLGFVVSRYRFSSFRTPVEQAAEVVANRSKVCWGAHMSNMARHIIPSIDGHAFTDGDRFERALGPHLPWFVAIWTNTLRSCGLRDAGGGTSWFKEPGLHDQLHVELPGAKIPQTDARATACVIEYVRLVNNHQGKRNKDFESKCQPVLATHLSKIVVP